MPSNTLKYLNISSNKIIGGNGNLSSRIGFCKNLTHIDLSNNKFCGYMESLVK